MDGLTIEQQRKAIHFAVLFLRENVESLRKILKEKQYSESLQSAFESRLAELERELVTFEELHDRLSL